MLSGDRRFVFVAPMFNASKTLAQLLHSIAGQSYTNWKLILIDDVSAKDEALKEKETVAAFQKLLDPGLSEEEQKVTVCWNDEKSWEVSNVLKGISMCKSDDIVCRIDADDWLTETDSLAILNSVYDQTGCDVVWTAHRWGFSDKNISGPMTDGADPYKHPWVSSHLKTFRKSLIDDVNDENFRGEDGNYIRRAGDQCLYLPILHNTRKRIYLPRVMYHYTIKDEPATYQTVDAKFQKSEAEFIRRRGYVT